LKSFLLHFMPPAGHAPSPNVNPTRLVTPPDQQLAPVDSVQLYLPDAANVHPHLTHASLGHLSPYPKRHLDRLQSFIAQLMAKKSLYLTIGRHFPSSRLCRAHNCDRLTDHAIRSVTAGRITYIVRRCGLTRSQPPSASDYKFAWGPFDKMWSHGPGL